MADTFEDFWDDTMCNSFVIIGMCADGLTLGRQPFVCSSQSASTDPQRIADDSPRLVNRGVVGTKVLSSIKGSFVR